MTNPLTFSVSLFTIVSSRLVSCRCCLFWISVIIASEFALDNISKWKRLAADRTEWFNECVFRWFMQLLNDLKCKPQHGNKIQFSAHWTFIGNIENLRTISLSKNCFWPLSQTVLVRIITAISYFWNDSTNAIVHAIYIYLLLIMYEKQQNNPTIILCNDKFVTCHWKRNCAHLQIVDACSPT